MTAKCNSEWRS